VQHVVDAVERAPHDGAVGDRAGDGGERGAENGEAHDVPPLRTQGADQCLTESALVRQPR
jgi:hypothetical protein